MAIVTLTFSGTGINPSLQVGDTVYYCGQTASTSSVTDAGAGTTTTFSVEDTLDQVIRLGTVLSINTTTNAIVVDTGSANVNAPSATDYIFFGKDNAANISSLTGYYASVKFVNNSYTAAELFSISAQVAESSK